MTTHVTPQHELGPSGEIHRGTVDAAQVLAPLGRFFLAAIFLLSAPAHFSSKLVAYAADAGVPMAAFAVPMAGVLALLGGLSILLGFRTKIGATLLVLFLVPVTLWMHRFWSVPDPAMAMMQQVNFMKNVAILGGVLLLAYFGAGPFSFDARRHAHAGPRS